MKVRSVAQLRTTSSLVGPVAHRQARQIGGPQGGGLHAFGPVDHGLEDVRLDLHEHVVGAGPAVHLQPRQAMPLSWRMAVSTSLT